MKKKTEEEEKMCKVNVVNTLNIPKHQTQSLSNYANSVSF